MGYKHLLIGTVLDDSDNVVGGVLDSDTAITTKWCISESGWEIVSYEYMMQLLNEEKLLFYHPNNGASLTHYCSREDVDYCYENFKMSKKKTVSSYGKFLTMGFDVRKRYLQNIPDHRNIVFPFMWKDGFGEKCFVGFWHVDPQSVKKDLLTYEKYEDKIFNLAGTCMIVQYTKPGDFTSYFETDCDFVEWHGQEVPNPLKQQWVAACRKGSA